MKANKKILSLALASAFTVMSTAQTFAATIYVGNVGFSTDKMLNSPSYSQAYTEYLQKNINNGIYIDFNEDGKAVSSDAYLNQDKNIMEFDAENGQTYEGQIWDGTGEPGEEAPVEGELEVVEVSAINAKTIKVVFNQKVTKATAEWAVASATGNITVAPTNGTADTIVSKLSTDGLSATLTLTTPMVNATGYDVTVTTGVLNEDGKALGKNYVDTFQFNDTVKPTVKDVKVREDGNVVVEFSEVLVGAPQFSVNGEASAPGTIVGTDATKYTVTLPAGVKTGDTLNIIVSGGTDLATPANVMNIYTTSIAYNYTQKAPQVTKLTAKNESVIELEFDKAIAGATTLVDGTNVKVLLNNVPLAGSGTDYTLAQAVGTTNYSKNTITFTATGLGKIFANNAAQGTVKVVVEEYTDTLTPANMGTKVERDIVLTKDAVKPALKGSVVYTPATATPTPGKITANLSEKVAATATLEDDIYVLDTATGVKYPVSVNTVATADTLTIAAQLIAGAEKIEIVNGTDTDPALTNGTYSLVIEKDAVKDQNFAANGNNKITAEFTVTNAASKAKPAVGGVAYTLGNNNEIKVTFTGAQVGVSAIDTNNYKLNGVALTGATITLDAAKAVATITLPEGKFATSGTQVLTISNVKSVDGVTMDSHEEVFTVIDNAKPKLTSAKIVDGSIILTFSENIDTTTVTAGTGTAFADADFLIKLNGVNLTPTTHYTVVDKTSTPADATLEKNQVKITPVTLTGINFTTAETLSVEVEDTATAKDAAGNAVVTETKITLK